MVYIYISKWSIIGTKVTPFLDIQHDLIRRPHTRHTSYPLRIGIQ